MIYIFWFLLWTLVIYIVHRIAHIVPVIKEIHYEHHRFIKENVAPTWHWSNIFLFQDNWKSTGDVWITEILPTILFCFITQQWWIAIFFYFWSAFIQESIEHNPKFDMFPFSTSGKWHLIHHNRCSYNYGIFHPVWDRLFRTYKSL